ncbi:MAG: hypothetical protein EXS33_03605 [Pedosphaera sp.]|nr:hypothetical protein [Pedosphaera sp.]
MISASVNPDLFDVLICITIFFCDSRRELGGGGFIYYFVRSHIACHRPLPGMSNANASLCRAEQHLPPELDFLEKTFSARLRPPEPPPACPVASQHCLLTGQTAPGPQKFRCHPPPPAQNAPHELP